MQTFTKLKKSFKTAMRFGFFCKRISCSTRTSKATCMEFNYDPNFTPFFNIKYIITGRNKPDLLLDVRNTCYTLIHTPYNLKSRLSRFQSFTI